MTLDRLVLCKHALLQVSVLIEPGHAVRAVKGNPHRHSSGVARARHAVDFLHPEHPNRTQLPVAIENMARPVVYLMADMPLDGDVLRRPQAPAHGDRG